MRRGRNHEREYLERCDLGCGAGRRADGLRAAHALRGARASALGTVAAPPLAAPDHQRPAQFRRGVDARVHGAPRGRAPARPVHALRLGGGAHPAGQPLPLTMAGDGDRGVLPGRGRLDQRLPAPPPRLRPVAAAACRDLRRLRPLDGPWPGDRDGHTRHMGARALRGQPPAGERAAMLSPAYPAWDARPGVSEPGRSGGAPAHRGGRVDRDGASAARLERRRQ